jgi:hypothetical protein
VDLKLEFKFESKRKESGNIKEKKGKTNRELYWAGTPFSAQT